MLANSLILIIIIISITVIIDAEPFISASYCAGLSRPLVSLVVFGFFAKVEVIHAGKAATDVCLCVSVRLRPEEHAC